VILAHARDNQTDSSVGTGSLPDFKDVVNSGVSNVSPSSQIICHGFYPGPCLEKENLYNMFFIFLSGSCWNICGSTTDDELVGNRCMLLCIMSLCQRLYVCWYLGY